MSENLHEKSDEELMVLYQQDNEIAFDLLYRRHSGKVYSFLKKRLSTSELVDDIFQATFLKFHRSKAQFDPSFLFNAWLFTICRSVMIDTLRKRKIEPLTVKLSESEGLEDNTPKVGQPVIHLDTLPRAQREAIEMRYLDEMNFEEIAKRLNTSSGNVRQLISRGIRQLKEVVSQKESSHER